MTIEKWYDQHTKSYVIQKKDKDGNQIGEAIYCGNKEEAVSITEELKRGLIKEKILMCGAKGHKFTPKWK